MNLKVRIKYIIIYLTLNLIAIFLAIRFWWIDPIVLSYLNIYTITLLFSVGISWIGILFISIMITRDLFLEKDKFNFISPLSLINNNYYISEIGLEKARKIKSAINISAFIILFLTIASFNYLIGFYEKYELKKYGVIENIVIAKTNTNIKKNNFVLIEYANKKNSINLRSDSLRINDKIQIIYSSKNPKIVKYYNEFKKNQ